MKIVFLSYLHGFGGAERQNIMLANAMAEKGHDVSLVSISVNNNCYKLNNRVKYIYLPDRKKNILRLLTRYQDIKRILKEIKPDITVSFWFQSAYLTALMKKSITGKIVYSERGDPGDKEYSGLLGLIRKITIHRIDGFVFQSKGAQQYFNNAVQKKSVVIPNPVFVNISDYSEVKERKKNIVSVGRLHPQKNQKLLINAFALISDKIPEYILEIYGDGELKQELQDCINNLGLNDRAFLRGTSQSVHQLIYDASLFVLSSDYEGLPNTLLEAQALGIPCISTDCKPGGAREIIEDGTNGWIVPINNKNILAEKMLDTLNNKELCDVFSINAKENSKRFKKEAIYTKWNSFFIQLHTAKETNK